MATPYRNPDAVGGGRTTFPSSNPDLHLWQQRREDAQRDRRRYESVWAICQAFIANKQWVGWNWRERRVVTEPNPQNRERHTVNVLTPYLMTNVGKFAADDLMPSLFFRNDSDESRAYAKQANRAIEFAWDEEIDADERMHETILRMCSFGIAAVQCMWTPDQGPMIQQNVPFQDGKPVLDPAQQVQTVAGAYTNGSPLEFRDVRGKLEWRVWSPQNILPPPGVNHERDFPWLIIEAPVALEKLRMEFGSAADNLNEQDLSSISMLTMRDTLVDSEGISQTTQGRLRNHAIVYRGYEMPTRKYTRGRTFIWSQDTVLRQREGLPYEINGEPHLGLRFFKYNVVPDRFWPIGLVEPGIGPQRQRNRSRSQYIEMKDRAGLGRIYTRPGSVNVTQLQGGKVFENIEVRPGMDIPTETMGTGPGPWLAQDVQMHDADMERVMGIGGVSMGQTTGGTSAYSAMALLAEQDDKRVGHIIKQIRNNVRWLVRYSLEDIRTYWGPQKQITLAGDEDQIEAFTFNASRLPSDLYVKVGRGAPAPRNQAAEIQKIMDIYDKSIASGRPLGMKWLYDSLESFKALPIPETPEDVQREKADVENMLIAKGGVVHVSPLDAHDIHVAEHTEAVALHQLIPEAADVVRALMEHIQEHEQAKQQAAGPAAAMPSLQGGFGQMGGQMSGAPQQPAAMPGALPAQQSGPPMPTG